MPIIKVATAEPSGVNRAFGWYSCGLDLAGAIGAIVVDKSRVQTLARLNAALALINGLAGWGHGYLYAGQAVSGGPAPLTDRSTARETGGRLPDIGPFGSAIADPALANPDIVMVLCRPAWTAAHVAQSLRQGPVIGGYGVAIILETETQQVPPWTAPPWTAVFGNGKAGIVQALTGVLA